MCIVYHYVYEINNINKIQPNDQSQYQQFLILIALIGRSRNVRCLLPLIHLNPRITCLSTFMLSYWVHHDLKETFFYLPDIIYD